MRGSLVLLAMSLAACGSVNHPAADAGLDAHGDPLPDAAVCQPKMLLVGGIDVVAQGWSVVMQSPAMLTYASDFTELQTLTNAGARTSGQLLLNDPGAVETGKPFKIQVVMLVEAVNPHNQLDSAAAILGSFSPPFGAGNDRGQMIYLDAGKIGWADDSQSFTVTVTNNAYHTYELSVDAAGTATVTVDGISALTRGGFVFNGAIAVGDQTNDSNVDSTLRIRSVTRLCL